VQTNLLEAEQQKKAATRVTYVRCNVHEDSDFLHEVYTGRVKNTQVVISNIYVSVFSSPEHEVLMVSYCGQ